MADSTERVEQALQSLVGKRIVKVEIEDCDGVDAYRSFQRLKITPKDADTVIVESTDADEYSSWFTLPKESS